MENSTLEQQESVDEQSNPDAELSRCMQAMLINPSMDQNRVE